MKRTFKRVLGACMLLGASLFFILFTGSINAAQKMGGPMSMSPSSAEWCLIVLFIDAVLVLIGLVGSKMFNLNQRVAGVLNLVIGVSVLTLGIHNQINSPQIDSINNGLEMPVASELNAVVYVIAALCVMGGLFMIFRAATKERSLLNG